MLFGLFGAYEGERFIIYQIVFKAFSDFYYQIPILDIFLLFLAKRAFTRLMVKNSHENNMLSRVPL
ncbi:hypothetical protein CEV08_08595 [Bartonella tribocorum]|uniref:Uncharacterized protein n=1 Tax=Bartonella tribocorum TaxID=85701 RepID=A0A2N9Y8T0_9HYPH|nr:hypothetical protein CEV08_08595 [Bartonella tribocorum]